ncbi:MAG: Penicillin-binding protein 2 [Berkelbacteria bacterium GW2011_GWB1_38_5]|uniref:Penicillin-binding protein 2 n=1 Tax=Berkelbacteria bacterium GW2011_GWB1_38_5 TaxID=1618336 RepID=A0A0G0KEJ1_9BACT|nr:MAG: Penicillin-binding protein 2 [Berkelbacteria bacterium GW2011_GWB1_38_5]
MSIFDLYDDKPLGGDKSFRKITTEVLEYEHYKNDAEGEEIFKAPPKPLWVPYLICAISFTILLTQLLRLQIANGAFNRTLAEGNRVRVREVTASRGLIYDSKGVILAKNKASFNLEVYPLDLPKDRAKKEAVYQKLSQASQISEDEIKQRVTEKGFSTYDPIVLKENIDRDTAMILEVRTINLPGVVISKKPIREYNSVEGFSQIIGYVGKMSQNDLKENPTYKPFYEIGKDGLEFSYEKNLKGIPGILEVEVDSKGQQQRQLSLSEPFRIDANLEYILAQSLKNSVIANDSPGGSAVAINPQNGQILAMVSYPTFDNNLFSQSTSEEFQKLISDPSTPLFNRPVSGTYPSGSIVKPFVAAAGLQEGVITENTTINATGEIRVGNYVYPDWKVHGLVDVRKALAVSANVFFYAVAGGWDKISGLGIARLNDYLVKFGFGSKTGIDLPGEATGLVPDPAWKEKNKKEIWYLGNTYQLGIGQGDFLITPLQMATAYSAIANSGELLKPQIVAKISNKDGKVVYESQKSVIKKDFISGENLTVVREGMRQAVTIGSAKSLADLPVTVGAKTGTAQFGSEGKTHGWIAAFAPTANPEIVVIVLVEAGGEGYSSAGPVAKDVLYWYFTNK